MKTNKICDPVFACDTYYYYECSFGSFNKDNPYFFNCIYNKEFKCTNKEAMFDKIKTLLSKKDS